MCQLHVAPVERLFSTMRKAPWRLIAAVADCCSCPSGRRKPSRQLRRAACRREGEARRGMPHMLRHSCGYYLADQGTDLRTMQDYLGHRDPKHTAHYTRVAGHRFEGLWR